jgi:ribosomal protein L37AE/L43A
VSVPDLCSCCPKLSEAMALVLVNGAWCCPSCDAMYRFPAIERETKALARLMADMLTTEVER